VADGKFLKIADGVNLLGLGGKITRIDSGTETLIREQLARSGREDYNILLIHQPVGFRKTAALGIDLQLSGHTHRGQILPMNILIHLVYPYAYGLHALGDSHIYVSSGTGTWGPPLRIGSSSEIVKIKVS
jgi:predicted MPP superfamily phosphohydrolase